MFMTKRSPSLFSIKGLFLILILGCLVISPIVGQVDSSVDSKKVEQLVTQLIEAKSLEERLALTDTNKSLITDELIKEISKKTIEKINKTEYEKADEIIKWLIIIGERNNNQLALARGMQLKGNIYRLKGEYGKAEREYENSLKIAEQVNNKELVANALNGVGVVHSYQGKHTQALEYYLKSLNIREDVSDKHGVAESLNNIGNVHSEQGNYTQALEYYLKSLNIREEIEDKKGVATALNNIGHLHLKQDEFCKSIDYFLKAAFIASDINVLDILWQALAAQGKAYMALNQLDDAYQALLQSITTIEKLRSLSISSEQSQQSFFQDKTDPYYAMVNLMLRKNDLVQALSYAERAKGRVVLDVLHSGRANLHKHMTTEEVEKDQKLASVIYTLNTQLSREVQKDKSNASLIDELKNKLEKARLEYEAFQTSLYVAHPELKIQRGDIPPINIDDAANLLDKKNAILEYVVTDDVTYLFVLTKSKEKKPNLQVYTINIKSKDLEKRINDFHQIVSSRNLAVRRPAQELYSLLLKPALKQIEGIDSLCIIPDRSLWNLPFQALDDGNRWMIDHFSIYYAPSLSVLHEMKKRKNKQQDESKLQLLALGNPKLQGSTIEQVRSWYRGEALSALPNAEEEVKTLGTLYGKDKSRVLTGDAAKEEVVKEEASKYRIVHFATHGILDDKSPLYSRLMLASEDGAKEDGMLEAWEIMKMDLQADMAVLAACETARGRVSAGEGMIGMSWALFVAGVPTTVVSQWKVDSEATSKLMIEFHKNLLAKKSKTEAMREAARKIKDSYDIHPYYWAGFSVIGNGD
jgi:CHAT domain-containing protein